MVTRGLNLLFFACFLSLSASAQPYRLYPFPNIWYNSVDKFRIGVHLKGQMKGTLDDGPHRFQGGIWMASAWPKYPISYFAELTEPVFSWSSFGSEAAFTIRSQFRTGFEQYALQFTKRLQDGFLENEFTEHSVETAFHNFYTSEYAIFRALVESENTFWGAYTYRSSKNNQSHEVRLSGGLASKAFAQVRVHLKDTYEFTHWLKLDNLNRIVIQTKQTPAHLREFTALSSYYDALQNPFFRARGTVPLASITDFPINTLAFAGSRADIQHESKQMQLFAVQPSTFIVSTNFNLMIESPLTKAFSNWKYVGDVLSFSHYAFFDASIATSETIYAFYDSNSIFSLGSGIGFSLSLNQQNVNPFLKAFSVKYELPVWRLGNPDDINGVSFRQILSLSGTITF
jgi:hypothetical protein